MGIGRSQDAGVAARSGELELPGPGHATGGAKEPLLFLREADGPLRALEMVQEVGIGVQERGPVIEVVVADLVPFALDPGDEVRVAEGPLADEEERRPGAFALQDVEHLGSERGVRSVIEGERHQRLRGGDAVHESWSQAFEDGERRGRLRPIDEQEREERDGPRQEHAASPAAQRHHAGRAIEEIAFVRPGAKRGACVEARSGTGPDRPARPCRAWRPSAGRPLPGSQTVAPAPE